MNIKEHIEAGHYPKDDKGRALVPIGDENEPGWCCGAATVLATDGGCGEEIIARYPLARACHWSVDGRQTFPAPTKTGRAYILLPPPPRKVKVTAWGVFHGATQQSNHHTQAAAEHFAAEWQKMWRVQATVVELTGEYEKQWS